MLSLTPPPAARPARPPACRGRHPARLLFVAAFVIYGWATHAVADDLLRGGPDLAGALLAAVDVAGMLLALRLGLARPAATAGPGNAGADLPGNRGSHRSRRRRAR